MPTLADALVEAARVTPHRVLLVDGDMRLDCESLHRQASVLAQALLSRMPTGGVVSFMLPNWYEAAVVYLAATMAGIAVNPILPSLRDRELSFILGDVESAMIFIPREFRAHDYLGMLERVTGRMASPPEIVVLRGEHGDHTAFTTLLERESHVGLPTLDSAAVRMILYTSGTTGRPKGVLHSHDSIRALIDQLRDHWLIEPGDKFLVPSPIAHIGGSIYAFECPLLLGTTAVLVDRWDPDEAVTLMVSQRCTHMAGATPFLEGLLAAAERAGTRLPDLKVFICGGASVSPSLIRRATAYFDRAVVTRVYGSTEVPVTTVGSPTDPERAADTDGRPGIATVKLVAHAAAPEGSGEMWARGPQMLVGYRNPEDDRDAFDDEGYFRTGDLAQWVDDDHLVVTGRAKDIIIRSGENIAPKEIEDILTGHPDILEIAIVGLPDARTGERACAVIVPRDSCRPDVKSIGDFLADCGVAKFKAPEQVVIAESLPKNDAGKVLKHQIRAELAKAE
jgi:acyl-CoA synthetase (AMP-forming)/AMP-acid ligase II